MDLTSFLASLWGPILVAVAVGIFFSRTYYVKIYRDLEKSPLAVLTFGIFAMLIGLLQVMAHNVWGTVPEIVVSFLGWATLLKGLLFITAPNFVDKGGDYWAKLKLLPIAGGLTVIVGLYLTWIGYFM